MAAFWRRGTRQAQDDQGHRSWDKITLGGVILPGLARISSFAVDANVQHKAARGSDGGKDVVTGLKRPEFTIELELSRKAHWEQWERIARKSGDWPGLLPAKRPTDRNYLPFYSPFTAHWGVSHVLVVGVRQEWPRAGVMKVAIKVLMATPPKSGATHAPSKVLDTGRSEVPIVDLPTSVIRAPELRDRVGRPSQDPEY